MLLRPQRTRHILRAFHDISALIVETQDRRHTVPACRAFQRRSQLLAVADASGRRSGTGRKTGGYKSLLLHAGTGLQRTCNVVQIPHLIPLIGGKSCNFSFIRLRHKSLHLHIGGCHQRAGHAVQVNALVPLVDVISIQPSRLTIRPHKSCLYLQCTRQLFRQFLAAFRCSAQDAHAGFRGQIVFDRRICLQNLRQGRSFCVAGRHPSIERRGTATPGRNHLPIGFAQQIAMTMGKVQGHERNRT